MPRLWLNYLSVFIHPSCPSFLIHSHARKTFDRALRVLAKPHHERVWRLYLKYAQDVAIPSASVHIFRRFLKVDPLLTEHCIKLLLAGQPSGTSRPLEAAKLLLKLSRLATEGKFKSVLGKSPYQLLVEWLQVVETYPEDVGITDEEAQEIMSQRALRAQREEAELDQRKKEEDEQAAAGSGSTADGLMRFAGPPVAAGSSAISHIQEGQDHTDARTAGREAALREAEEYMDATDPKKLDVEDIIRRDGINVYQDQAGRLWTGLATYWIKRGEFDKTRQIFEEGISTVLTVRDFTQIFDAYAEFYESSISALMEAVAEEEEGSAEAKETEQELDSQMKDFEELMDRRPFLLNEVLLRRNPNDVQEWEKRIALWGTNDEEIQKTYENAINSISPRKTIGALHRLYINYAKFFEEGGAAVLPEDKAERDLPSARKILEKAIKVNFKKVDDLAEVWCEWAEMEVRNE
jgi:pre-mRNA-splicing factor SYF1